MKKIVTLIATAVAACALAGCNSPEVPETPVEEAKTAYTDKDKEVFDNYLVEELPFWAEASTVKFDEYASLVTLTGDTTASELLLEKYAEVLEDEDYNEFDRSYDFTGYSAYDVFEAFDFSEDFDVYVYEKNIPTSSGEMSTLNQIVAIGADADDDTLVAIATVYFSTMDYMGGGYPLESYSAQYDIYFGDEFQYIIEETFFSFYMQDNGRISNYTPGSFVFPEDINQNCEYVGCVEMSYIMPFAYGNLNNPNFLLSYELDYYGVAEDKYSAYCQSVLDAGYDIYYVSEIQISYTEYMNTYELVKETKFGTCVITISDLVDEMLELQGGTTMNGFTVEFAFVLDY